MTSVALTVTAVQGVVNGGFENGTLGGWSASGAFTPRISTTAHSGTYSVQVGSTAAVNGDSTLTQTVAIPSGSSRLTFWYQPHCPDTITYDQIQMQIRSTAGATLATVLNVCSNSGAWTQVSFNPSSYAGQTVVLWFNEHFGEIKTAEGKPFMETQAYKQSAGKLTGVVTLYRRNAATYGEDIRKLNTKRHTVAQALSSSDYSLMEKQRIKTFSRDVFGQLGTLNW